MYTKGLQSNKVNGYICHNFEVTWIEIKLEVKIYKLKTVLIFFLFRLYLSADYVMKCLNSKGIKFPVCLCVAIQYVIIV